MHNRLKGIRFIFIRSHIFVLFLSSVILLSLLLSVHVLFEPEWLTTESVFLFIISHLVIGFPLAFYAGFNGNGNYLKTSFDAITLLIKQYANGNYQSSIQLLDNEDDEIHRASNSLNELGKKLQDQVKSLQKMADEKSELAKSAHKTAVIEERQRIARDLHDAVSQELFALAMLSEAAIKQLDLKPELAKAQMLEVSQSAHQAQTEMRALLLHLRPVYLSGESLIEGLHKLINELKQKSNLQFTLKFDDQLEMQETIEEHIFRIVQESLSNILRHANATEVYVEISKKSEEIFILIEDNGEGFDMTGTSGKKTSYGLKTMKERSEEIGGTFTVRSNVDEGTYIQIRIPYEEEWRRRT